MRYSDSLEERYSISYKRLENLTIWGDNGTAMRFVQATDTHKQIEFLESGNWVADEPFHQLNKYDSGWEFNADLKMAYFELHRNLKFGNREFSDKILNDDFENNEPLPRAFLMALHQKKILDKTTNKNGSVVYSGLDGLELKTYGDLPIEFIEGIKSYDISIESLSNKELIREAFVNRVAKACEAFLKRP